MAARTLTKESVIIYPGKGRDTSLGRAAGSYYDELPIAYFSLDEVGRIVDVNAMWLHMLGYEKPEVMGRGLGEFVPKDYIGKIEEAFTKLESEGQIYGAEIRMASKDGQQICALLDGRIIRDRGEKFLASHFVVDDITDRRRMEDELHTNFERYNGMVGKLQEQNRSLTDANEKLIHANRTLQEIENRVKAQLEAKNKEAAQATERLNQINHALQEADTRFKATAERQQRESQAANEKLAQANRMIQDVENRYKAQLERANSECSRLEKALRDTEERIRQAAEAQKDRVSEDNAQQ